MGFITIKNLHHSLGGSRDDDFPLRTQHRGTRGHTQATERFCTSLEDFICHIFWPPKRLVSKEKPPKMTLLVLDDDN